MACDSEGLRQHALSLDRLVDELRGEARQRTASPGLQARLYRAAGHADLACCELILAHREAAGEPTAADQGGSADVPGRALRACYTADPEHGLELLLALWPRVRQARPQAELVVCFDQEAWHRRVEGEPERLRYRSLALARRLSCLRSDGVSVEDWTEVYSVLARSGLWVCPQPHGCKSRAIEAMLAGCWPVVGGDSLRETLDGWGSEFQDPLAIDHQEALAAFADLIAQRMFSPPAEGVRDLMAHETRKRMESSS